MVILELEILSLECDGVVEEELRGVFENFRDRILVGVPMEGARDIGEDEGNVVGCGMGESGGHCRERMPGADGGTRDGAIGKRENCSDRVDVLLGLSRNTLPVKLVLLKLVSAGEPRCVEDANLGKRLRPRSASKFSARTTIPFLLVSS